MAEAMTKSVLILLVAAGAVLASAARAEGPGDFVLPSSQAAEVENCVEPTEYMRRNHFEVIRHQRDTTVYGGIRSTKHSLSGCVSCHVGYDAAGQPVDIQAQGQFCSACHEYAAVEMNCFDCHATVPKGELWNQEIAEHPAHAGLRQPRFAQQPATQGRTGDQQ